MGAAACLSVHRACLVASFLSIFLASSESFAQRVQPASSLQFLPPVTYGSGADNPFSVATADVNRDGKIDLIIANQCPGPDYCASPGVIGVLLGNGDGTFEPALTYSSGGAGPDSVAVADLNGDGNLDIATVNGHDSTVAVLLGNGDGTFQSAHTFPSGGYDIIDQVLIADVNGDGKPDLLIANDCSAPCDVIAPPLGEVTVFLGKGDGTFKAPVSYSSGAYWPTSLAIGDLNGDGKADLVMPNFCAHNTPTVSPCDTTGPIGVLLGNGDGTFQPVVLHDVGVIGPHPSAIADLNGDGKPDVVIGSCQADGCGPWFGGRIAVLLGHGDGTFAPAATYGEGTYFGLTVADVNADSKPDIVAVNWACPNNTNCVEIMLGNGDGTFQAPIQYDQGDKNSASEIPYSLAAVDLNGDGRIDVVATHGFGNGLNLPPGTLDILINNGSVDTSTTTTVVGTINPVQPKQRVDYIATVTTKSGDTPTGTVTFFDGSRTLTTLTLFGNQARLNYVRYTRNDIGSTHAITASYSGDANNDASTSTPWVEMVKVHSTMSLLTSGSPSLVGQSVTFTASVHGNGNFAPDGEVISFFDGKTLMGTAAISGGNAKFTTSALAAKRHTIHAFYPGDTNYDPSTHSVIQIVNRYPSSVSLAASPNPSQVGQSVTFTATVTASGPFSPTGHVKFLDGSTGIGVATLSGGVAVLSKSGLAAGTHPITAQYLGDAQSDPSTSPVVNQEVNP